MLYYQPDAIGVRPLARIAGLLPRSAELAIPSLVEEQLVIRQFRHAAPLYVLNRNHAAYGLLAAIFSAATKATIIERSRKLSGKAMAILPFIAEAGEMLACGKRSLHVT